MSFILLSIATLFALLLLLLAVPITVAFRIDRIKKVNGYMSFQWLFGLLRFRIGIPGAAKAKPRRKPKPSKKSGKRKPVGNARSVLTLLNQSAFRRRAIRLIKNAIHATNPRDVYLRLRIGLGDPADTGRLWALLGPVAGIATNLRSAEVRIEPEFMDPVLEVESHGALRLIPLQFLALVIAFVASPTTMRAWRMLRQSNA
ncbi:MAG: DUF2953 domain-containing protein [Gammaproteobacteria bacterium]|nr:DUF2953 domain-containing protein [Gammaproteobacteria bacterium]